MFERLKQAAQAFEEDPENETLWKETDEMDQERQRCMLKAEKTCRTKCAGRVPHSDIVNKEGAGACFFKLAIKSKSGAASRQSLRQKNTSSRRIKRIQKKAGPQHVKWNMLGVNTLKSFLKDQKATCNSVKKWEETLQILHTSSCRRHGCKGRQGC